MPESLLLLRSGRAAADFGVYRIASREAILLTEVLDGSGKGVMKCSCQRAAAGT